jgi:hypothetical protein
MHLPKRPEDIKRWERYYPGVKETHDSIAEAYWTAAWRK